MIEIENVVRLDDAEVTGILKYIETSVLVTVLAGASDGARDRVLAAMNRRAAAFLLDELELRGSPGADELAAASASFGRQLAEAVAGGDLPRRIVDRLRRIDGDGP